MAPLLLVGLPGMRHPSPTNPLMCHGSILMAATTCPALLHRLVLLLLLLWVCRHTRRTQLLVYRVRVGGSADKTIYQRVQLRIAATRVWPRPTEVLKLLLL